MGGAAADEATGTSVRVVVIQESRPLGEGSFLAVPDSPTAAVLVLSGSSGRLEQERARLLAEHGATALAWQWFEPPELCEVSLESFSPALDLLHSLHPRLVVLGLSKGAEAALLLAVRDARIQLVVAISPTSVVWAGLGCGDRSSFTSGGRPHPFISYDENWRQPTGVPAFRGLYEHSLAVFADLAEAATIRVEDIAGAVIVAAGGDDQVWPSDVFARRIADRRAHRGLDTTVLFHEQAGHRLLLPGESPIISATMKRGGSVVADQALGTQLWEELVKRLDLRP